MRGHGVDKFTFAETARGPKQQKIYSALSSRGIACLSPYDIERDHLPYSDGQFSLIIFQQVIEHLHNSPKLVFDEIARTLRPGGVLVLDTPNHAFWLNRINLLKGKSIHWDLGKYYRYEFSTGHTGQYFGHTREFTPRELAEMAGFAGLVVETAIATAYSRVACGRELRRHFLLEAMKALSEQFGAEISLVTHGNEDCENDDLLPGCVVVARKPL
jgi:SAM-dependent methyltransferase